MQFVTTWCMLQQKSWQIGLMIPVLDSLKFKLFNTLNHCTKIFWEPFDAVTIIYTFGILTYSRCILFLHTSLRVLLLQTKIDMIGKKWESLIQWWRVLAKCSTDVRKQKGIMPFHVNNYVWNEGTEQKQQLMKFSLDHLQQFLLLHSNYLSECMHGPLLIKVLCKHLQHLFQQHIW